MTSAKTAKLFVSSLQAATEWRKMQIVTSTKTIKLFLELEACLMNMNLQTSTSNSFLLN